MADGDIVLQFGLKAGRNADAVVAAEALIAWVDMVRDAARAIDPNHDVRVEILGREEGSLRNLLRLVDDTARTIGQGADEFPHLKKAAIGLAAAISTATLSAYIQEALQPAVQPVALSAEDRKLLQGMTDAIREDQNTARAAVKFFKTIERDPAVTDVRIAENFHSAPSVIIPRSDFSLRAGMWSADEGTPPEELRREVWDVVLLQAPFYHSARHWVFQRDGLKFSAQMQDAIFLQAIIDRTIPIALQEGVIMRVEIEYRERLNGQVWEYVPDSRRISRVLSPRPRPAAATDAPKKEQ